MPAQACLFQYLGLNMVTFGMHIYILLFWSANIDWLLHV